MDYTIRPASQLREVAISSESEAQKSIRQRLATAKSGGKVGRPISVGITKMAGFRK
jgi:hypothetical protein